MPTTNVGTLSEPQFNILEHTGQGRRLLHAAGAVDRREPGASIHQWSARLLATSTSA